jgi:hypothetical protein
LEPLPGELPTVADITKALERRAVKGRDSGDATEFAVLKNVAQRIDQGSCYEDAVDHVLWMAIRRMETPHLVGVRGAPPHPQDAIRCYLAIYARLNVAALIERAALPLRQMFPDLGSEPDDNKHRLAAAHRKVVCAFDSECQWSLVRKAMSAALSLNEKGSIDKFVKLAPSLLAAELIRDEAMARMPKAKGPAFALREIEERLESAGLLAAYCDTETVRELVRQLGQVLEEPLHRYTLTGTSFKVFTGMLETTYHSLRAISSPEDNEVSENDDYFDRQLEILGCRGIAIQRIFLFDEGAEAAPRQRAAEQEARANEKVAQSCKGGSYKPYFVPRAVAQAIVRDPKFFSVAIFDEGWPTQRVATQMFGTARRYQISCDSADIETAAESFESLKSHSTTSRPNRPTSRALGRQATTRHSPSRSVFEGT